MKTNIRKIGNSAGTILPSPILKKLRLVEGDLIEITEDGRRIVITPTHAKPHYKLKDLLSQCNEKASPPKDQKVWDGIKPVGKEIL